MKERPTRAASVTSKESRPGTTSVRELKGVLAVPIPPVSVNQMQEAVAEAAVEPYLRRPS